MSDYWFDHIHLKSKDPLETAKFYENMFGANRISQNDEGEKHVWVKLDLNGVTILINQPRKGDPTGLAHFGIRTNNLDESIAAMKKRGVRFTTDVIQLRPDFKASFLVAPDNVSIELQEGQW